MSDARVSFGGVKAIDGVTLRIDEGKLYGLVGPNGSGKSTVLAVVSRLLNLDSGSLFYYGEDCTRWSADAVARAGLRRTFQSVRLLPRLTVLQNVMIGADISYGRKNGKGPRSLLAFARPAARERMLRERAAEALDRVGLADVADEHPSVLSYGNQRRVEIARALIATPKLLLLDEPTAGMNRQERVAIGALLLDLKSQGVTQIFVEHDVKMISEICTDMYVLNRGRLIASGTPRACIELPEVQAAYLGRRHAAI
jgi:branched-chain amino acid transport system ATP-binding protein